MSSLTELTQFLKEMTIRGERRTAVRNEVLRAMKGTIGRMWDGPSTAGLICRRLEDKYPSHEICEELKRMKKDCILDFEEPIGSNTEIHRPQ